MATRELPFEAIFGRFRDRFEAIRLGLETAGLDPANRDGFLLHEDVAGLLRELRPDEGLGDAMSAAAALVHHAYLFWAGGERVMTISAQHLSSVLGSPYSSTSSVPASASGYVQLPPLMIWCRMESGPPEPLDGWFHRGDGATLTVLAILGFHRHRAGLTAVEAQGARPDRLIREDGSAAFAPLSTETGASAGIGSIADLAELLELAWRVEGTV